MTLMESIELKLMKKEMRKKVVDMKLMEEIHAKLQMEMRMKVIDMKLMELNQAILKIDMQMKVTDLLELVQMTLMRMKIAGLDTPNQKNKT